MILAMCNLDTSETNLDGVEAIIRGFVKKFEEGNGEWEHHQYIVHSFLYFSFSRVRLVADFVFWLKQNKTTNQ